MPRTSEMPPCCLMLSIATGFLQQYPMCVYSKVSPIQTHVYVSRIVTYSSTWCGQLVYHLLTFELLKCILNPFSQWFPNAQGRHRMSLAASSSQLSQVPPSWIAWKKGLLQKKGALTMVSMGAAALVFRCVILFLEAVIEGHLLESKLCCSQWRASSIDLSGTRF